MEAISLLLADEHPLIQVGFRGRLRLGEGLEVQIVALGRGPIRRRLLPRHKRRALELIASGCDPSQLAEGMGLCLERAEALHEELSRNMGLDRIARQVRLALGAGTQGGGRCEGEIDPVATAGPMGDRMMDDIELVRSLFPEARAASTGEGAWAVLLDPDVDGHRLGEGRSPSEAWAAAAARLSLDEWFRPIIAQLRAMKSERGSGP